MDRRASRLTAYVEDRLDDGLRAVGYHTDEEFEVVYVREDLVERYPPERVERFIRTSRTLHDGVQSLDDEMGPRGQPPRPRGGTRRPVPLPA